MTKLSLRYRIYGMFTSNVSKQIFILHTAPELVLRKCRVLAKKKRQCSWTDLSSLLGVLDYLLQ